MKLYQKITVKNYDDIITKIKSYLNNKGLIDCNYAGYIPLNTSELVLICPELIESLALLDLKIISSAIYRTTDNSQSPVHIDHATYQCRINIPILNCEYSSTVFYKAEIKNIQQQNHSKVNLIECKNAVEIDRVTIDSPTILRINSPHQVVMDESKSPRICLTVRCDPDPVMLFTK